jgi:hypothetical protein
MKGHRCRTAHAAGRQWVSFFIAFGCLASLSAAACGRAESSRGGGGATKAEGGSEASGSRGSAGDAPSNGGGGNGAGNGHTGTSGVSQGGRDVDVDPAGGADPGGRAGAGPAEAPTFSALVGESASQFGEALAAGDLDDDGEVDLVISRADGYLGVRLGNGDGTFANEAFYWLELKISTATDLAIGDVDADGKPDLVAAVTGSNAENLRLLLNQGDGTFGHPITIASERVPLSGESAIAAVDLNGDHLLDLAVGGGSVLLNLGQTTFEKPVQYPSATTNAIAAGDLDGDGAADLVLSNGAGIVVLLNEGDGEFSAPAAYAATGKVFSLAVADLDGDGRADVVAALGPSNDAALFFSRQDGSLAPPAYCDAGPMPWAVAVGDFNADLRPDLAFASFDPSIPFSVIVGDGHGAFSSPVSFEGTAGRGLRKAIVAADLNDDGRQDLAAVGHSASAETVFINTRK